MTGLMAGKRGLIMGVANDHSIAWGIARMLHQHGARLAFTYQGEALGRRVGPLAAKLDSDVVIPCDVEDLASVDAAFDRLDAAWVGPSLGISHSALHSLASEMPLMPMTMMERPTTASM